MSLDKRAEFYGDLARKNEAEKNYRARISKKFNLVGYRRNYSRSRPVGERKKTGSSSTIPDETLVLLNCGFKFLGAMFDLDRAFKGLK